MQHLIRKQIIALGVPESVKSFEVQQTVRDYYLHEILPVLEQVFDELSDEEETIFIDQLQIDLGSISAKDISRNNWDQELLVKIKKQLYERIGNKKEKAASHESRSLSVCKQWLFYMEKGYLPWNTLHTGETWYQHVLEALATDYKMVAELRYLISTNPNAVKRIVFQHPQTFLVKLVEILTAQKQNGLIDAVVALQEMLHEIKRFDVSAYSPPALQKNIWQQMIRFATVDGAKLTQDQLIEKAMLFYLQDISMLKAIVANKLLKTDSLLPVTKKLEENPEAFSKERIPEFKEKQTNKEEKEVEKEIEVKEVFDELLQEQIDEEGIFVANAGIVLLHAFLPTLLNRLQLVNNGRYANEQAQQKALYLIHYIATGKTDAEEHELIIPKVLCAWNLNKPVEKKIELTAEELNEAENMMLSAIEQWTVLKNTSIDGLREGFLQRNAKLYTRNNNVYLLMENKSIDVLLDQLPWNLSIVKLPWMKEILRVEWR